MKEPKKYPKATFGFLLNGCIHNIFDGLNERRLKKYFMTLSTEEKAFCKSALKGKAYESDLVAVGLT